MNPTAPAPWKVFGPFGDKHYFVERDRLRSERCLSLADAEAKCADLNRREQTREAAEDLLEACKAMFDWCMVNVQVGRGRYGEVMEAAHAAIKKAEPTPST